MTSFCVVLIIYLFIYEKKIVYYKKLKLIDSGSYKVLIISNP